MSLFVLTAMAPTLVSVGGAMAMAAVYSALFFVKKRMKSDTDEPFDKKKFLATVLVGAVVGAGMALSGAPVTQATIMTMLPQYVGAIALAEALVKAVFRGVKRSREKNVMPSPPDSVDRAPASERYEEDSSSSEVKSSAGEESNSDGPDDQT